MVFLILENVEKNIHYYLFSKSLMHCKFVKPALSHFNSNGPLFLLEDGGVGKNIKLNSGKLLLAKSKK